MNSVFIKGKWRDVPSEWNDLTGKQLCEALNVLTGPYLEEVKRIRLLKIVLGWSWWRLAATLGMLRFWDIPAVTSSLGKLSMFASAIDRTERLAYASEELTKFFFDGNTITKNLLPKYKGFYGPADNLANLKAAEFVFAENYFLAWKDSGNTAMLNKLIAVLWRPGKKTPQRKMQGDYRDPFNQVACDENAKLVDKWPMEIKAAMAVIYDGMRRQKIADNEIVFSGNGGGDPLVHGLWSVMRSVSKAGHLGDLNQVFDQYIDTILMELTEAIIEGEKMEEQFQHQQPAEA